MLTVKPKRPGIFIKKFFSLAVVAAIAVLYDTASLSAWQRLKLAASMLNCGALLLMCSGKWSCREIEEHGERKSGKL